MGRRRLRRRRADHRITTTAGTSATAPPRDEDRGVGRHAAATGDLRVCTPGPDAQQAKDRLAAGEAWQGGGAGLVFTRRYGTPVDPRGVNRAFTARAEKAGVRRITPHDARRTCASLLADLDVHPRVAMQILRHADFAVTMEVYTQVSSKQTREALKRLGESLG
jgi:integrase